MTNLFNVYTNEDSVRDGYPQFEAAVQAHFDKMIDGGKQLFTTTAREELYELYLANLPEHKEGTRQHYTCHGCRQFWTRYGGLVTIDADGNQRSAILDFASVPTFFGPAVAAMQQAVQNARVDGVFIPDARVLGTPKTGEWTHVHVRLPEGMANRSVLRTAYQVSAAKREDYNVLRRVSSQHNVETVESVIALLKSETVYRGERYVPAAEWFRNVLVKLDTFADRKQKENFLWLAAVGAPTGFIPSNSSNVGQTLNDINGGASLAEAGRALAQRLNPATFMRAQSAPTANKIREDEKIFAKFVEAGLVSADSLKRRYAKIEEVPAMFWWPKAVEQAAAPKTTGGVFGHLTPKDTKPKQGNVSNLPSTVMTWAKFQRTVLPTADKIEALIDNPDRFMALVTAAVEGAPNMLRWDNTFSWYYHGGVDAEIKERVEAAGGRYENNDIRVSLAWEGFTDLDLHGETPYGEHIYWSDKRGRRSGGYLDIDMNGGGHRNPHPVENIRFATGAPNGRYRFYVHNFCERGTGKTAFKVELALRNGKKFTYNGVSGSTGYQVDVFEFDYVNGEVSHIRHAAITSDESWTAGQNTFVEVTGITTSPNLWGEKQAPEAGNHTFFLLKDVKDTSEGAGRGFFNEHLISELREIRRTLEHFAANATIEGADEASACGIGFNKDQDWNVTLKVTTGATTQLVKIDRWD
jgi:hypothetical protein